jgi:hypothetical protein
MITAVHTILYSRDAEAVRGFLRDVLELPSAIRLPDGGELGLYEPRHPLAARAGS